MCRRGRLPLILLIVAIFSSCHAWQISMFQDSDCNGEDEGYPVVDLISEPNVDSGCVQYDFSSYGGIPGDFPSGNDPGAEIWVDIFPLGGDPESGCDGEPSFQVEINDVDTCMDFAGNGYYQATSHH